MDKRELKAMAETEARLLAVIDGRTRPYVAATLEQAQREWDAVTEALEAGAEIRVVGGSIRP